MQRTWVAVVVLAVLLSACGPSEEPPACDDGLTVEVTPTQATLNPGETLQATAKGFTCGGTMEVEINTVWESADEAIATVSDTGLITAGLQGGNTTIFAIAPTFADAEIAISVPVVDPIP